MSNPVTPTQPASYRNRADVGGENRFSVPNFVPEIWTNRIKHYLEQKRILTNYVNRDYEGDIKEAGDRVWVYGTGKVFTDDYIVNHTVVQYESAKSFKMDFTIDQSRYWAFEVEDIEKAQSKPEFVSRMAESASEELARDTERFIYARMLEGAAQEDPNGLGFKGGTGADPLIWDVSDPSFDVYEAFVALGIVMTDALVEESGRFVIVPSFVEGTLRLDPRFIAYGQDSGNTIKTSGKAIGTVNGIEVVIMPRGYFGTPTLGATFNSDTGRYEPNTNRNIYNRENVDPQRPDAGDRTPQGAEEASLVQQDAYVGVNAMTGDGAFRCVAGQRGAVAYAEQFSTSESIRSELAFVDRQRGLLLFGGQAMQPNELFEVQVSDNGLGKIGASQAMAGGGTRS